MTPRPLDLNAIENGARTRCSQHVRSSFLRQGKVIHLNSSLELLGRYADAFRELVNARVWTAGESPARALRLNSPVDWSFICVAMDVVGDAALAIGHFLQFSLSGPTKINDVGENYLRLYGLLSATYIQQEAVLKLFRLMNCPMSSAIRAEIETLEIRVLRNQLASHSVDYRDPSGGKTQAFVPVRIGLTDFSCEISENRGNSSRTVQLIDAVNEHCRVLTSVLDKIYEKSIGTLFRGRQSRIEEFNGKLADLRFVREGNILVCSKDEENPLEIRIALVSPADGDGRECRAAPEVEGE